MTNPRDFAERLQAALDRAGMTSKALAEAIGLSWQAIRKYKAGGSTEMYATNLFKSARVLQVNALWLATGEGPMVGGSGMAAFDQMISAPALEVALTLDAIADPEARRIAYLEIQQVLVRHSDAPPSAAGSRTDAPPKPDPPRRSGKPPGQSPAVP
jgi:transcriptional regulator with XRE-family HTH domain